MNGPTSETRHVAVYPGSFDPFTLGHFDLAQRASRVFSEVVVAIAQDAEKQHGFTLEQRVDMARDACAGNANIRVASFEGLVVNYARSCGARVLVKGLRAVADFERELQMDAMNRTLAPDVDTLYLMAAREHAFLSASLVKHVHSLGGDVSAFVTPYVRRMLDDRLRSGAAER